MALDNYTALQASVLNWLARPGDPLVAGSVPDMIALFEAEAARRLRVVDAETGTHLGNVSGDHIVLPGDCVAVRSAFWDGLELEFITPGSAVFNATGIPRYYTLFGANAGGLPGQSGLWTQFWLLFGPVPQSPGTVDLVYQVGLPPLGVGGRISNWLLQSHADAYLFGTLVEAEAFIGHDERIPLWLQRRDAVFASIKSHDRKTRWGGPMQIRVDGITSPVGGSGGSGGGRSFGGGGTPPPVSEVEVVVSDTAPSSPKVGDLWFDLVSAQTYCWVDDFSSTQWVPVINQAGAPSLPVAVIAPASGDTVSLGEVRPYYVDNTAVLAALTLQLPSGPQVDDAVTIGFRNPVTSLTMQDGAGAPVPTAPSSAYGPGAAIEFRYVSTAAGWVYWK